MIRHVYLCRRRRFTRRFMLPPPRCFRYIFTPRLAEFLLFLLYTPGRHEMLMPMLMAPLFARYAAPLLRR